MRSSRSILELTQRRQRDARHLNNPTSQVNSDTVKAMLLYSDSDELLATVFCFLDFHDIRMLDRLAEKGWYCFLDGYSGYNQISIALEYQEKTTFTCPYGTFAFKRMPFGLCNAPATCQRCMMLIFSDIVENTIELVYDQVFYGKLVYVQWTFCYNRMPAVHFQLIV
uniref:Reverse transcriptase domain-containing protein n=1 Tax=Solanum lycopersicum TaxID=4081 RepID=A0A3Q7ISX3_SOLLC